MRRKGIKKNKKNEVYAYEIYTYTTWKNDGENYINMSRIRLNINEWHKLFVTNLLNSSKSGEKADLASDYTWNETYYIRTPGPPADHMNRFVDTRYRLFSYHTHNICILTYKLLLVKIAEQIVTKSSLTSVTQIQSFIILTKFYFLFFWEFPLEFHLMLFHIWERNETAAFNKNTLVLH